MEYPGFEAGHRGVLRKCLFFCIYRCSPLASVPKSTGSKARVKATKAAKHMELHESEEENSVLPQQKLNSAYCIEKYTEPSVSAPQMSTRLLHKETMLTTIMHLLRFSDVRKMVMLFRRNSYENGSVRH